MKFKEPITEKCPHCEAKLEFTLNWILEKGQVCNFCKGDLEAFRSDFQNFLDDHREQWRIFANIVETALVVEDKFSINFDDEDLFKDDYNTTVLDIINSTNRLLNQKASKISLDEIEKQIIKVLSEMFPNETFKISLETKFKELGKSNIP